MARAADASPRLRRVEVSVFRIPTDRPESDGTLEWGSTTIVVVEVQAGDARGIGYSYTAAAAATLIAAHLRPVLLGTRAADIDASWEAMVRACRNVGQPGIAATAVSAVDCALWDLKARLLGVPLVDLLGAVRHAVPAYGSGGFTSYTIGELQAQLVGWVGAGMTRVKMKVGKQPAQDGERVRAARAAIGEDTELFVDANGAYDRKLALAKAEEFRAAGVSWFEEPVSSDDLEGLRLIRDRAPAGMDIAAGEYGYDLLYFRRMLESGAVDVLQADATRCGGITGFRRAAVLCRARALPLSAHTAPTLHAHVGCAETAVRHVEYFHDHARIEPLLFDGALAPVNGVLRPAADRVGLGLTLKRSDAERYAA